MNFWKGNNELLFLPKTKYLEREEPRRNTEVIVVRLFFLMDGKDGCEFLGCFCCDLNVFQYFLTPLLQQFSIQCT